MRIRKTKRKPLIVILLILTMLISVGYAALTTNVTINGRATIKKQNKSIYFNNIQETVGSVTPNPRPTTFGKTTTEITWGVNLETSGQYYEFTVDAVNEGSTDAMVGEGINNSNPLTEAQQKYLKYSVTYSDGAGIEKYDKLKAGATETIKIRLEFKNDINAEDLPTEVQTITFAYTLPYVKADSNAKERMKIGDPVNYSTTVNGVELNNWKVFYKEGEKVYLKYGDYLPVSALPASVTSTEGIVTEGTYSVYADFTTNRETLINAMTNTENWNELLKGTMNGEAIDATSLEGAEAMGSPTVELFAKSWSAVYPSNKLYTATNETGCLIGTTEKPTTYAVDMSSTAGYNNTLYYPHKGEVDNGNDFGFGCSGYWLASPSANYGSAVLSVISNGNVRDDHSSSSYLAFCPVICLPSNVLK